MTEDTTNGIYENTDADDDLTMDQEIQDQASEKAELKARAKTLGLTFSPNIGLAKLRKKVNDAIAGKDEELETDPLQVKDNDSPKKSRRERKKDQLRLRRIRVTMMNPNKSTWKNVLFAFRNRLVGPVREVVPFNTIWHVPNCILERIKAKQYQSFYTVRDPETGQESQRSKLSKEYAVEILDDLTKKELKDLARAQAMSATNAQ